MPELIIPKHILDRMVAHCKAAYPLEACGILAGRDNQVTRVYEMTNTEASPVSYFMDSNEQFQAMKEIRNTGTEMLAIYHSHPNSPAVPSQKDVSLAFYAESAYVIVSLADMDRPEIKAYLISEGCISEIAIGISNKTV